MVDFDKDVSQTERIEKLREQKRRKEAEYERLEAFKKQELEEADEEIKKREGQLRQEREEKEEAAEEDTEKHEEEEERRKHRQEEDLEDMIAQERLEYEEKQRRLTEAMREDGNIYSVTNYNVYSQLTGIRNRIAGGEALSQEEEEFLEVTKSQTGRFAARDD